MNNLNNIQNFSSIDTILWDWNGTLLDDVEICVIAMNKMLARPEYVNNNREFYYKHFTFPVNEIL